MFRKLLLGIALIYGGFTGVPMTPEEIEEMMANTSKPKIAYTLPDESETGEKFIKELLSQAARNR